MSTMLCKLVPHSIPYGAPFGGITEITQTDIAAALSYMGLSDFETRYIRASLLQAEPWGPTSELGYAAWDWAVSKAIRDGWQIPQGKETVRRLSFVALASRIDRRHFVCGSCNGVGVVLNSETKRLDACQGCAGQVTDPDTGRTIGDGRKQHSDRYYGRLLAVDHKTYKATWESRLNNLITDLHAIEFKAADGLRRVIYGE